MPGHQVDAVYYSWQTGILISHAGHILTNYHLFKQFQDLSPHLPPISVRVKDQRTGKFTWTIADVLFMSTSLHLDVAVLQLRNMEETLSLSPLNVSNSVDLREGQPVVALGFPVFPPTEGMREWLQELMISGLLPSITVGILSKIVYYKGAIAILESSVPIHPGRPVGIQLLTCRQQWWHAAHKQWRLYRHGDLHSWIAILYEWMPCYSNAQFEHSCSIASTLSGICWWETKYTKPFNLLTANRESWRA